MDLEKITYQELLKHIDTLRSKNISDNHPDMLKAKWKLREFLQDKKKTTSLVPKLKSVKTVTLSQAPDVADYNKFVILGIALAACALFYKFRA
jgi:hypothetical protein